MTPVDPEEQLEFLSNIQRLISEGQFTATYKYALLLAIADICVEEGEDSEGRFNIPTRRIAEKFVDYYWRQVRPYEGAILRQNTGKSPAIIRTLEEIATHKTSLNELKRDAVLWRKLVADVARVVRDMPLWRLQTIGGRPLEFLYENHGHRSSIQLKPGVMFCLRRFHELVTDLVRGAWVRYVRRFNAQALGTSGDLDQFLFGSERASLEKYLPIFREVQEARCLYCLREVREGSAHIDHFIPWSRYPVDLGHNFVLAHNGCNTAKAEHLAALPHLQRWIDRNNVADEVLQERFNLARITHNADVSRRIAHWAYSLGVAAKGTSWVKGDVFESISEQYLNLLRNVGRPDP